MKHSFHLASEEPATEIKTDTAQEQSEKKPMTLLEVLEKGNDLWARDNPLVRAQQRKTWANG